MTSTGPPTANEARVVSPAQVPASAQGDRGSPEGDSFPSHLTCYYTGMPPERAVMLNIPDEGGTTSNQCFEYNAYYRQVSIPGYYSQYREVCHPLTRGHIDRRIALSAAIDVPPDVQARITYERELRGLAPADSITDEDRRRYGATMEAMEDRSQHPFELGTDEEGRVDESNIRPNSDGTEYHSSDELDDAPLVQDARDPSSFEARRERVRNPETSESESEDDNADLPVMPDMRKAQLSGRYPSSSE